MGRTSNRLDTPAFARVIREFHVVMQHMLQVEESTRDRRVPVEWIKQNFFISLTFELKYNQLLLIINGVSHSRHSYLVLDQ